MVKNETVANMSNELDFLLIMQDFVGKWNSPCEKEENKKSDTFCDIFLRKDIEFCKNIQPIYKRGNIKKKIIQPHCTVVGLYINNRQK